MENFLGLNFFVLSGVTSDKPRGTFFKSPQSVLIATVLDIRSFL